MRDTTFSKLIVWLHCNNLPHGAPDILGKFDRSAQVINTLSTLVLEFVASSICRFNVRFVRSQFINTDHQKKKERKKSTRDTGRSPRVNSYRGQDYRRTICLSNSSIILDAISSASLHSCIRLQVSFAMSHMKCVFLTMVNRVVHWVTT